jgi:hypothetical protein
MIFRLQYYAAVFLFYCILLPVLAVVLPALVVLSCLEVAVTTVYPNERHPKSLGRRRQ